LSVEKVVSAARNTTAACVVIVPPKERRAMLSAADFISLSRMEGVTELTYKHFLQITGRIIISLQVYGVSYTAVSSLAGTAKGAEYPPLIQLAIGHVKFSFLNALECK